MQIEINTDGNIEGNEALSAQVSGVVESALNRYGDYIMRVEVHLSDENSDKKVGHDAMRCMMAAHLKGLQHIAVTHQATTLDEAIDDAADKLTGMIGSILGRLRDQERQQDAPAPSLCKPETEEKS